ncbi:MAG: phosphoribosylglycinamide formyltransferase [Bacteroidales bacterium]|nr:phosphoribosylglycinamide formyltransferase [Bacteroidales bacterium]
MNNIAIFASGSGTNAENIINYFKNREDVCVKSIFCNNPKAFVIERGKRGGVPTFLFSKSDLNNIQDNILLAELKRLDIDYIILAGFLLKIPSQFVELYPAKIINIHPALLPNYGGKGMYGMNVHEAVIAAKEPKSGITIHVVDEQYDHGKNIFQAECIIDKEDTPDDLAAKIHTLEQENFPRVIDEYIKSMNTL